MFHNLRKVTQWLLTSGDSDPCIPLNGSKDNVSTAHYISVTGKFITKKSEARTLKKGKKMGHGIFFVEVKRHL